MIESDAIKLLFEVDDIASDIGLQHMLYGGTCLGAVRDKAFIDVDRDVAFCCLQEDFTKHYEAFAKALQENGFEIELLDHRHERPWDGTPYGIKLHKYGINCDFAGWFAKGKWRYVPGHKEAYMLVHKAEHFENLISIPFYERLFKIPRDYKGFLYDKYGNWKNKHVEFDNVCKPSCRKEVQDGDDFWWV